MKTDRILIINPFGIGDVLFATPFIKRLRLQFPASFIGFICNKKVEPILVTNKNINEVFVFEKGDYRVLWKNNKIECIKLFFSFLGLIKSRNFDIAVDLSLGHQYAFFLKLIGVPVRVGYDFKNRGRFLTHKIPLQGYVDKHIVEYYLDIFDFICKQANIVADKKFDPCLEIFIDEQSRHWADDFLNRNSISENDKILGIVPGGGASWGPTAFYKHWPPENFAKAADELAARYNAKIVLFGSKAEIDICNSVANAMRIKPVSACGKTGLLQFAALLKRCALVLCNDGGPLHIAVAMGAKTVSIFGPVDENVYGPYPPSERHIVVKKDISCRPCYRGFKFNQCADRLCLLNIRPQDVIRAAEKLLSRIFQ